MDSKHAHGLALVLANFQDVDQEVNDQTQWAVSSIIQLEGIIRRKLGVTVCSLVFDCADTEGLVDKADIVGHTLK
jgi:hypothetical protein